MAKEVKNGSVTVHYSIVEHDLDGEVAFDWVTNTGQESDYLFASAEEAEKDVIAKLGG